MSNQRNKRWALSITYTTLSTIVATPIFALLPLTTQQVSARSNYYQESKVAICHRTNSVKNPYVEVHIDKHAYDGENKSGHKGKHTGKTVKSEKEAKELKSQKIKWGDVYIGEVSRKEKNDKNDDDRNSCDVEKSDSVKEPKEHPKNQERPKKEDCRIDEPEVIKDDETPKPEEKEAVTVVDDEPEIKVAPQVLGDTTVESGKLAETGSNPWVNAGFGGMILAVVLFLATAKRTPEIDITDITI